MAEAAEHTLADLRGLVDELRERVNDGVMVAVKVLALGGHPCSCEGPGELDWDAGYGEVLATAGDFLAAVRPHHSEHDLLAQDRTPDV